MDDRKKRITELERHKKDQLVLLDVQLTRFGEALFCRIDDVFKEKSPSFGDFNAYQRYQNDITESETAILTVEEQLQRLKELEENIETKDQEQSACLQELSYLHGSLGKLLLDLSQVTDNTAYAEFCAQYREQAGALLTKVLSLEERLNTLEQNERGNVFIWIGKNAQGLVLRSFLTKAQENLEQLRRTIGERYSRQDAAVLPGGAAQDENHTGETSEVTNLCAEIEQKRAESRVLSQDVENLKEEMRTISGSFSAEGGPLKQIQSLKNHISQVRDELKSLFRRVGAEAASINSPAENIPAEHRQFFDLLITAEDQETLDSVTRINNSIQDIETAMEKLKASLAIDDEKAKIEKYRRMILDRKEKIVHAEKNITEFEAGIRDSEASIEKLQKLL